MWRTARTLGRRAGGRKGLPSLLFFTDPVRTPSPERVIARLPRGAGVVFRTFGAPDAATQGRELAAAARRRGVLFLVGADAELASTLRADGLHLPERAAHRALRYRRRGWIVTAAAHSLGAAIAARRAGADAVVMSPVFPSRSPSAGKALGPVRFAALVRRAGAPAYALGGVNALSARRLTTSGAIGLAAVDGLLED
jgi:thiamine-phosphate pyrophosphorylase